MEASRFYSMEFKMVNLKQLVNLENMRKSFYGKKEQNAVANLMLVLTTVYLEELQNSLQPESVLTKEEKEMSVQNNYPMNCSGKIQAIKLVKDRLKIGLGEAKMRVEQWYEQNGYDYHGMKK
jgi:ribosomal protein L7/L12